MTQSTGGGSITDYRNYTRIGSVCIAIAINELELFRPKYIVASFLILLAVTPL